MDMGQSLRKRSPESEGQRGQATVEFVFAMVFLLMFVVAIMQALMFELDVFNKIGQGRLEAFDIAHRNQNTTKKGYFHQTIKFKKLGGKTNIGAWRLEKNLQYPDKRYYMRKGTKYFEPITHIRHETWTFALSAALIHYQGTAKYQLHFPEYAIPFATAVAFAYDDLEELQYAF